MTVENLTTVLMSAEESPLRIISRVGSILYRLFSSLIGRIESCIPSVEQQVKVAAMCYISSHREQPTWKEIATAALYGEEEDVAIKACDYCTRGELVVLVIHYSYSQNDQYRCAHAVGEIY